MSYDIFFLYGEEKLFDPELFFAALAGKTRLRLLNLKSEGGVCVCFFAEALGTNNPKISRHLSYLKRANLVTGQCDGKWIHYSISESANEPAAAILAATMKVLENDEELKNDRKRLSAACCLSGHY